MKVFVLGTGGWGIALAMLLHQNGHQVTSWTYQQAECDLLHRERCTCGSVVRGRLDGGEARVHRKAGDRTRKRRQGSGQQARLLPLFRDHRARRERQESGRCADRPDARGGGCARHPDRDRCGV